MVYMYVKVWFRWFTRVGKEIHVWYSFLAELLSNMFGGANIIALVSLWKSTSAPGAWTKTFTLNITRGEAHIPYMYSLCQDPSHSTVSFYLVTLNFDLNLKNLNIGCYIVMVAAGERYCLLTTLLKVLKFTLQSSHTLSGFLLPFCRGRRLWQNFLPPS